MEEIIRYVNKNASKAWLYTSMCKVCKTNILLEYKWHYLLMAIALLMIKIDQPL